MTRQHASARQPHTVRTLRGAGRLLAGLAAVAIGVTLAPPDANALAIATAQSTARQVVLNAKRDAAQARTPGGMLPAVNTTTKPSPETEPLAEATLAANTAEKLSADSIGLTAEFSGYEIDGDLDIRIAAAPEAAADHRLPCSVRPES